MTSQFAANLIGTSNSLSVVSSRRTVTKQGNGRFIVSRGTKFADGSDGYAQIAVNVATVEEARKIAKGAGR